MPFPTPGYKAARQRNFGHLAILIFKLWLWLPAFTATLLDTATPSSIPFVMSKRLAQPHREQRQVLPHAGEKNPSEIGELNSLNSNPSTSVALELFKLSMRKRIHSASTSSPHQTHAEAEFLGESPRPAKRSFRSFDPVEPLGDFASFLQLTGTTEVSHNAIVQSAGPGIPRTPRENPLID